MKFNKKVLSNGLTVLHEKRDLPVTTVMLASKFGSRYESEKDKGIAHFIEHLCFKGTEKRTTEQIAAELEKVGGILNAFTSEEETAYHVKLPSKHLDLAMDVIFDIFFNPTFPEKEIEKEGGVICEEIRMYRDNPAAHVLERIKGCLYKKPFGMFIAGTEDNIKKMKREDLLKKHSEVYFPGNAILTVVGNNEFEDVVKLAEKFCVNNEGKKPQVSEIKTQNLKSIEKRGDLQQANLAMGFHFPKTSEKEKFAAEVFLAIFGQGMSSKLWREVREKRGLAYAIKTEMDAGKDYGYLVIYIGTGKDKVREVINLCVEEFSKMKDISEKEVEDAKEQVMGNYDISTEDCANVATNLLLEEISGKAEDYYDFKKEIAKVTLKDIKELAEKADYSYFALTP
jgi:predicted Zn-dependent peptidase